MKSPYAQQARVESTKVLDYLLSGSHPDGRSKAEFFMRFGFRIEEWQEFAAALKSHAATNEVTRIVETAYGTRYSVDGEVETPDGRNPLIRTVWQVDSGHNIPRLIAAHPTRR